MRYLPALVLLASLAAPAAADAPPELGRIAGRITLSGPRPRGGPPVRVTVDPAVCGDAVPDEALVLSSDGGVESAVVVLRGVPAPPPPGDAPVTIDNAHCRFVPRVQVARRGQPVRVRNSDPVLHNAHPVLVADPEVSIANLALSQQGQTMDLSRRLAAKLPAEGEEQKEAIVRLGCDVHPWMIGWLLVVDHPWAAVTGGDGAFALERVPPGSYTLAIWHETLGRIERPVTVGPGETATVDAVFPAAH
jgi:hypothetical protein